MSSPLMETQKQIDLLGHRLHNSSDKFYTVWNPNELEFLILGLLRITHRAPLGTNLTGYTYNITLELRVLLKNLGANLVGELHVAVGPTLLAASLRLASDILTRHVVTSSLSGHAVSTLILDFLRPVGKKIEISALICLGNQHVATGSPRRLCSSGEFLGGPKYNEDEADG